jgi:hypothetical protein
MNTKLFGLIALLAWLGLSPARAITFYDYNVDFAAGGGEFTGSIETDCDACALNSTNYVISWTFNASDGSSINSSEASAEIILDGTNLQATATGIYTLGVLGSIQFCGDEFDCLNIYHFRPPGFPLLSVLVWIEGTEIVYGSAPPPGFQIAELADTVECTLGNGGQLCVTIPAPTPLPTALPLFATGLGGLGLLGWRRKRRAQAVP